MCLDLVFYNLHSRVLLGILLARIQIFVNCQSRSPDSYCIISGMRNRQVYRCPVCGKSLAGMEYCYSVDNNDLCSEECAKLLAEALKEFDRFRNGRSFAFDLYTDYKPAGSQPGRGRA